MTTKVVEGVVMAVSQKTANTRNGPKPIYDIKLHDGSSEGWYKFGFEDPKLTKNQRIKFVAKEDVWTDASGNQRSSWIRDKAAPIEAVAAEAPAVTPKVQAAVRAVDTTQRSIVLQSAFERSIMTVGLALENDMITLPKAKAAKFDALKGLIKDTALEYAELFIAPPASFTEAHEEVVDASEEDVFDDEYRDAVV